MPAATAMAVAGRDARPVGGPQDHSPGQIRASLERILAQPEYNHPLAKILLKVQELWRVLERLLDRLGEMVNGLYADSPFLYFIVVSASMILLLLILAHIGYVLYRALNEEANRGEDESQAGLRLETPTSLAAEAEGLAARGAYVDGIRMLFRSLGAEFRRQGKAGSFDTETNREFAMRWCGEAGPFEQLQVLVRLLDDKWYGMQTCSLEDYRLCRRMYDQIVGMGGAS